MVSGKTDCITGELGYILDYEQYIELSPFTGDNNVALVVKASVPDGSNKEALTSKGDLTFSWGRIFFSCAPHEGWGVFYFLKL